MENKDILKHLEKAERYDALGFYSFADEIFNNLKPYIQNLPKEAQLRIMSHKKFGPQSAASINNKIKKNKLCAKVIIHCQILGMC